MAASGSKNMFSVFMFKMLSVKSAASISLTYKSFFGKTPFKNSTALLNQAYLFRHSFSWTALPKM